MFLALFLSQREENLSSVLLFMFCFCLLRSSRVKKVLNHNVSRTCCDLSSLKMMKKKSKYVFLKNIHDCIEFKKEKQTFNNMQLMEASRSGLIDKHVYALGGMSIDNIKAAKDLGFGGVVICGDLWCSLSMLLGGPA